MIRTKIQLYNGHYKPKFKIIEEEIDMNFIKILGGIGAGLLAGAGLIVAGRTGLGKSDAEPEAAEPATPAEVPATETAEEAEVQETPAEEAAE